ncbi:MAG: CYTH domain-containing protein [Paludibacteraceae bacterium]|nr:CYTH domain-containing protein [Paludibacteraceae bacterium]
MGHQEIERKFLVTDDSYKQLSSDCIPISQGYLSLNERCSVRVRRWGDKGFITVKSHIVQNQFSRYEWEKEIPANESDQLLALCLPGKIEKKRWLVPLPDGLTCEVDEFFGLNQGLVMAEIELTSENQPYSRPDFLGKEVTGDPRFFNSYLLNHPYITWNKNE